LRLPLSFRRWSVSGFWATPGRGVGCVPPFPSGQDPQGLRVRAYRFLVLVKPVLGSKQPLQKPDNVSQVRFRRLQHLQVVPVFAVQIWSAAPLPPPQCGHVERAWVSEYLASGSSSPS
jgi:hypothetical protein